MSRKSREQPNRYTKLYKLPQIQVDVRSFASPSGKFPGLSPAVPCRASRRRR